MYQSAHQSVFLVKITEIFQIEQKFKLLFKNFNNKKPRQKFIFQTYFISKKSINESITSSELYKSCYLKTQFSNNALIDYHFNIKLP